MAKSIKAAKKHGKRTVRLTKRTKRGSQPLTAVAQGTGRTTKMGFGSLSSLHMQAFDAFAPQHLALPRPVGSYIVVRTTHRFNTTARALIFGRELAQTTTASTGTSEGLQQWSEVCARYGEFAASAINSANNCHVQADGGMSGWGQGVSCVPAAFSVQIMNPNALQTTDGIVYIGRCKVQLPLANSSRTWDEAGDQFISYQNPRLCSAGKLALRGVQIDALPINMNALSDFRSIVRATTGQHTWDGLPVTSEQSGTPTGFTPIVVYNQAGAPDISVGGGLALEYLVCTEWRMRFDMGNPAASAHANHGMSNERIWHALITAAERLGNGVIDIGDKLPAAIAAARGLADVGRAALPLLAA